MFDLSEKISQLEPAEIERVEAFVNSILTEKPRPKVPPRRKKLNPERFQAKILAAPIWSEEEVLQFEADIRELRANWREPEIW
jgi:hypothetical protein